MRVFVFALALLATSASAADVVVVERVVALVNDTPLLASQVTARAKELNRTAPDTVRDEALSQLIDDFLIREAMEAAGVSVSPDEIDKALESVAKQNNLTQSQLELEVLKQGYSLKGYRESLGRQILALRWLMMRATQKVVEERNEAAMEAERKRLLAALRGAATIEVKR